MQGEVLVTRRTVNGQHLCAGDVIWLQLLDFIFDPLPYSRSITTGNHDLCSNCSQVVASAVYHSGCSGQPPARLGVHELLLHMQWSLDACIAVLGFRHRHSALCVYLLCHGSQGDEPAQRLLFKRADFRCLLPVCQLV